MKGREREVEGRSRPCLGGDALLEVEDQSQWSGAREGEGGIRGEKAKGGGERDRQGVMRKSQKRRSKSKMKRHV